jgi:hypothetical protein
LAWLLLFFLIFILLNIYATYNPRIPIFILNFSNEAQYFNMYSIENGEADYSAKCHSLHILDKQIRKVLTNKR